MTKCNKKSVTKFASLFIITLTAVGVANRDAAHAALTGYWAFDGNYSDGSGNGHTATPHGDAALVGGGLIGGAVSLDGNGDWVDVADHADHEFPQGTDFSLTLFYNGPNSDSNNGLLTKGYANNPRDPDGYYLLQVTNPNLFELDTRCCAGGTPRFRTGQIGPDITDDQWHNVTVVRDYGSGEFRSYIDGNLEHTATLNPTNGGDWNMGVNGEALTIGDHLDRFTTGLFDDVAVFKGQVLSESDIAFIASNGVAAFVAPAVPEPSSVALAALGLLSLGFIGWRNRRGSRAPIAERSVGDPNSRKIGGASIKTAFLSASSTIALALTVLTATSVDAATINELTSAVGDPLLNATAINNPRAAGADERDAKQNRDNTQTMTLDAGSFPVGITVNSIYIPYEALGAGPAPTLEIFSVANPTASPLPESAPLFSAALIAPSNANGVIEVLLNPGEQFNIGAGSSIALQLDTNQGENLAFKWESGTPAEIVGGDYYEKPSNQFDPQNLTPANQRARSFGIGGTTISAVPEPATFLLAALGLLSLGCCSWRWRSRAPQVTRSVSCVGKAGLLVVVGLWAIVPASVAEAALTSPTDVIAEHNRLGSDTAGMTGASGNTIDASGFPGSVIDALTDPSDSISGPAEIWYVKPSDQGAAVDPPEIFYYDLGQVETIESVTLWNQNGTGGPNERDQAEIGPITQIDVDLTNGTPGSFTLAGMGALSWIAGIDDQAVSAAVGTGQTFAFASPVTTRYLRMTINTATQGNNGQFGFNEFAVTTGAGAVVPEPATFLLAALGLLSLGFVGWRRRRRAV